MSQFIGNTAKKQISKRVLQRNKAHQIFKKVNISYPLIRTRRYQRVRNDRFLENLACFFYCNTRFEIRLFALLPTNSGSDFWPTSWHWSLSIPPINNRKLQKTDFFRGYGKVSVVWNGLVCYLDLWLRCRWYMAIGSPVYLLSRPLPVLFTVQPSRYIQNIVNRCTAISLFEMVYIKMVISVLLKKFVWQASLNCNIELISFVKTFTSSFLILQETSNISSLWQIWKIIKIF